MSGARFTLTFVAGPEHIDELGHVNNAVWVQWMEAIATAHWRAVANAAHLDAYVWVVTRHEIDFAGNVRLGDTVTARTHIPSPPQGARFDRVVEFSDAGGRVIVRALTTWAMIERTSGRLRRIPAEVAAPFLPAGA